MRDVNPKEPGREVNMGKVVMAAGKMEKAKSKADPVRFTNVGLNRSERFVSVCSSLTEV